MFFAFLFFCWGVDAEEQGFIKKSTRFLFDTVRKSTSIESQNQEIFSWIIDPNQEFPDKHKKLFRYFQRMASVRSIVSGGITPLTDPEDSFYVSLLFSSMPSTSASAACFKHAMLCFEHLESGKVKYHFVQFMINNLNVDKAVEALSKGGQTAEKFEAFKRYMGEEASSQHLEDAIACIQKANFVQEQKEDLKKALEAHIEELRKDPKEDRLRARVYRIECEEATDEALTQLWYPYPYNEEHKAANGWFYNLVPAYVHKSFKISKSRFFSVLKEVKSQAIYSRINSIFEGQSTFWRNLQLNFNCCDLVLEIFNRLGLTEKSGVSPTPMGRTSPDKLAEICDNLPYGGGLHCLFPPKHPVPNNVPKKLQRYFELTHQSPFIKMIRSYINELVGANPYAEFYGPQQNQNFETAGEWLKHSQYLAMCGFNDAGKFFNYVESLPNLEHKWQCYMWFQERCLLDLKRFEEIEKETKQAFEKNTSEQKDTSQEQRKLENIRIVKRLINDKLVQVRNEILKLCENVQISDFNTYCMLIKLSIEHNDFEKAKRLSAFFLRAINIQNIRLLREIVLYFEDFRDDLCMELCDKVKAAQKLEKLTLYGNGYGSNVPPNMTKFHSKPALECLLLNKPSMQKREFCGIDLQAFSCRNKVFANLTFRKCKVSLDLAHNAIEDSTFESMDLRGSFFYGSSFAHTKLHNVIVSEEEFCDYLSLDNNEFQVNYA